MPFKPKAILYHNRTTSSQAAKLGIERVDTLAQLLGQSDFVIVCCALNDSTRELFNRVTFAEMKPNAIFINTSR